MSLCVYAFSSSSQCCTILKSSGVNLKNGDHALEAENPPSLSYLCRLVCAHSGLGLVLPHRHCYIYSYIKIRGDNGELLSHPGSVLSARHTYCDVILPITL